MTGFIGVHIGAGCHSEKLQMRYEKICRQACKKGIEAIRSGKSAVDAVAIATVVLEDSQYTNAGLGSSLTWDGEVECDASLMDGDKLGFGAVGGVSKIKNPILAAHRLCLDQYNQLSLNRVPPCFLVSTGAEKWALEKGLEIVEPHSLITEKSLKVFKKYKKRAELSSKINEGESKVGVTSKLLDTVGAIVVDSEGRVAASCSSGGIVLKHPGRVGQVITTLEEMANIVVKAMYFSDEPPHGCEEEAFLRHSTVYLSDRYGLVPTMGRTPIYDLHNAVNREKLFALQDDAIEAGTYGCGCWAQNHGTGRAVATSVTGCGEDLIKTCLAREAANSLYHSAHATVAINNTIRNFLDSPFLGKYSERLCGIIAIETESTGRGEFTWGHTTPSMAVGFMSVGQKIPKSHISRLPLGAKPGSTVIIEGTPV